MNIFITGIAGFIGFHTALALKKRGDFVYGCDNFNAYYDPALKYARQRILQAEGIEVIKADICDKSRMEELIAVKGASHVLHLAAQAGVRRSLTHPEEYIRSNVDGFATLLEALKKNPSVKLVYASSSSVYGRNVKIPFSEEDRTDDPSSLYGATKQAGERLASAYHHLYGISVTGLRFFTVYGPWGRPDMAYYSFAQAIASGNPIEIYNRGAVSRDFTYIDDVVQGILAALDLSAPLQIFNLGNNRPEKVLDLVRIIEEKMGKKALIELAPMQRGDVVATYADIEKSRKILRFSPKTSLEEGMGRFLAWFEQFHEKDLKAEGSVSKRSEATRP